MAVAYIALGTNLGDRLLNLSEARRRLRRLGTLREGLVFETQALRRPGDAVPQRPYLNAVDELVTALSPLPLLRACKRIERLMGRVPTYRWGPRVIDLDVIRCGEVRMDTPELTLPHPRLHQPGRDQRLRL